MTKKRSLFEEMDQAAALMCSGSALVADLMIEFRELVKMHYPDLPESEWMELFRVWLSHHIADIERHNAKCDVIANKLRDELSRVPATQVERRFSLAQRIARIVTPVTREPVRAQWISESDD